MKKRFKAVERGGYICLLKWVSAGRLFGAGWETIEIFEKTQANSDRVRKAAGILNECSDTK